MSVNFTNITADDWVQRAKELRPIYDEIGPSRFEHTVTRVINEHVNAEGKSFAPNPAEFRLYIVPPEGQAGLRCALCHDSNGFIYHYTEIRGRQYVDYVTPCKHPGLH